MRTFTIKYVDCGRTATANVQGNEISTLDDLFCISHDGMPIATFPKDDVLHVTSHGNDGDWAAPVVENLGMPLEGRPGSRVEHRDEHWMRLRSALDSTSPSETDSRARRVPAGGEHSRRHDSGVAVTPEHSPRSGATRSW